MANHILVASMPRHLQRMQDEQKDIIHQITCACDGLSAVLPMLENGWPDRELTLLEVSGLIASMTAHTYLIRNQLERLGYAFDVSNDLIERQNGAGRK